MQLLRVAYLSILHLNSNIPLQFNIENCIHHLSFDYYHHILVFLDLFHPHNIPYILILVPLTNYIRDPSTKLMDFLHILHSLYKGYINYFKVYNFPRINGICSYPTVVNSFCSFVRKIHIDFFNQCNYFLYKCIDLQLI